MTHGAPCGGVLFMLISNPNHISCRDLDDRRESAESHLTYRVHTGLVLPLWATSAPVMYVMCPRDINR